jgi:hypothetical protein
MENGARCDSGVERARQGRARLRQELHSALASGIVSVFEDEWRQVAGHILITN